MTLSKPMEARLRRVLPVVPILLALVLFLVPAFARASGPEAHLIVGGKLAPFVVPPYVGDDGQVWAPVDFVRLLGASYTLNPDHRSLTITAADGHTFVQRYVVSQERFMIPVAGIASRLGAVAGWDSAHRTMTL